jgi:hypothetical protein
MVVLLRWEDTMPRQMPLDLGGDGLRALWSRLPPRCRGDAVAIWTQLVARAARDRSDAPDTPDRREEEQR